MALILRQEYILDADEIEKRINTYEMNCIRRLLQVHDTSHTSNKQIRELTTSYIGKHEYLLTVVKRRQPTWFGLCDQVEGQPCKHVVAGRHIWL